jgi:hypothetical protein
MYERARAAADEATKGALLAAEQAKMAAIAARVAARDARTHRTAALPRYTPPRSMAKPGLMAKAKPEAKPEAKPRLPSAHRTVEQLRALPPLPPSPPPELQSCTKELTDSIVNSVISKFLERSRVGIEKYGTTLDRKDLTVLDWITHAQEELMDGILYLEKLKETSC